MGELSLESSTITVTFVKAVLRGEPQSEDDMFKEYLDIVSRSNGDST